MPELLCAGQLLCEPVYYASAYLPFILAIAIPAAFFLTGRRKQTCLSALILVVSAGLSEGLKYVFNVQRPISSIDSSPGFPSSHASIAFSEARILKFNRTLFILGLVFSVFTAFGRVYTGHHTIEDVLAGAVLGYTIGELIIRVQTKISKTSFT